MDKKKVLSIHPGHNATVGLFGAEEYPLVIQEEKLNNIKNYLGVPLKSIEYLRNILNGDLSEIDNFPITKNEMMFVSLPEEENLIEEASRGNLRNIWNYLEYYGGSRIPFLKDAMVKLRNLLLNNFVSPKCKKAFEQLLKEKFSIPTAKINYYDHHTCHCFSPVFFYNLKNKKDKYLLFSMDGAGDGSFAKIFSYDASGSEEKFSLISDSRFDASLGLLYSEVTRFLGMKPYDHEYKVMGLAAYVSEPKYYLTIYNQLKKLIFLNRDKLQFESKINLNIAYYFLKDKFTGYRFDNVAAATQKLIEDLVVEWIEAAVKQTGIRKIACSGGVFLNIKMNKKIQESLQIQEAYFMPSCGDESNIFGASYLYAARNGITLYSPQSMYLGMEYTNEEVETFLKTKDCHQRYKIIFIEDIERKLAELLAQGEIVARFKGKGEFGARALGHRSILGNPSDIRTFYRINDMIKRRDFWMPFAPTILEECAGKYIKNWEYLKNKVLDSCRFMITSFDTNELANEHLLAAMHPKDKTLRPQILGEDNDPKYYKLLKYFEELTGIGGILNTSLNLHGLPLVGTLEQAMFTFDNSGLEVMALEDFLISKK